MSYVRMNYFEYISEQAADELEAHYVQNAPDNFPDATALVFFEDRTKNSIIDICLSRQSHLPKGSRSAQKGYRWFCG